MILGIDPGITNTGFAVLNYPPEADSTSVSRDTYYELVETGILKVGKGEKRYQDIYQELEKIIKKYEVKEMAIENLFFANNAKSAIKVAQAIGVIKVCGMNNGLEVAEYTPLQVKMALTGYGRAEKEQVELMVRNCLNISENIKPSHAADAVAVALTHGYTMKYE